MNIKNLSGCAALHFSKAAGELPPAGEQTVYA